MMKKLLLLIIVFMASNLSSYGQQMTDTIEHLTATYSGQSDKAYYFTDNNTNTVIEFKFISKDLLSRYDLADKELIGKKMKLSYYVDYEEMAPEKNETIATSLLKRLTLFEMIEVKE
jgi:hypothetical protein